MIDPRQAADTVRDYRCRVSAMHQPFDEICTTCGHAELHRDRVRSAFWEGERLVVVEGISALTCGACGERFYDHAASAALDELRRSGFPADKARCKIRVPVFQLAPDPAP